MSAYDDLADQHRRLLEDSAISQDVVNERGYRTATRKTDLETLGFARPQRKVPALVIPIRDAAGEIVNYQIRPDQPRIGDRGKPVKYESPAGIPPTLDVPPRCRNGLRSPHTPLWITEGARKADAAASIGLCCVSLPGVWSWAKRLNGDAREVLPDLQRVRLEDRKVVIAFDSDAMVKPDVHKALEALNTYLVSQSALVHHLYLPEPEDEKCGLDDFLAGGRSVEQLWEHVEDELRPLSQAKQNQAPAQPTAKLLGYVENAIRRHVKLADDRDEHELIALSLYVLHTWAIEAFDVAAYLYVRSAVKRSGKTRLLEVLGLLVREPLRSGSVTEAAVYQAVEKWTPTFLIDEVDAVFRSGSERAEALRGVINAGNRRGSPVIRGSQDGEPVRAEVFCPKVLAGINDGRLPDTIQDRVIVIGLERKLRSDAVQRLRIRKISGEIEELRERLEDWAAEHTDELADYECEPLPQISDRLEEAWEPLWVIASLVGPEYVQKARDAAVALAGATEDANDEGEQLLAALWTLFENEEALSTKDICDALNGDEELPFGAHRKGEGIDGRGLARLLKPHGIRPQNVRIGNEVPKGYKREQFEGAWARYTPETESPQGAAEHPLQALQRYIGVEGGSGEPDSAVADSESPSATDPLHVQTALESENGEGCSGVADVADEVQARARAHFSRPRSEEILDGAVDRAIDEARDEFQRAVLDVGNTIEGTCEEIEATGCPSHPEPAAGCRYCRAVEKVAR